jgi:NAD(P)-dependent dehydrogenase (short-subunit alcohol dehydrogenase family)
VSTKWTAEQIPDQSGRTAVVTGANSGLGVFTERGVGAAGG